MPVPPSKNAKAPLLNWDVFSFKYNSLMEDAVRYHESILSLKKIAKINKWSLQQQKEAIENISRYAVIITDPLQQITFICHAFEKMTGYHFDEVKGRNPKFLQGPATSKVNTKLIKDRIALNQPVETIVENYRKDGELYFCKIIIKPIMGSAKNVVNYIAYEQEIAA